MIACGDMILSFLTFPGDFPNGDLKKGELREKESFLCGDEYTDPGGVVPVGLAGDCGKSIKAAIAAVSTNINHKPNERIFGRGEK